MNTKLFYCLYSLADKNKAVRVLAVFFAKYVNYIFMIIYGSGLALLALESRNLFLRYLLVPFFTLVYNTVLRKILNKQRPFVVLDIKPRIEHEDNGSCPSNHSASALIIALGWFLINPFFGILFTALAIWTGISRVIVGVHYPVDVIIAWIIAVVLGGLGFFIL